MRILLISKTYPLDAECGGTGAMAKVIAEGLVDRGHEVLVVSSYRVSDAKHNGVSVHARLIMDQPSPRKMATDWGVWDKFLWMRKAHHNYAAVSKEVRSFRPDIVYLNDIELLTGSVFAACVDAGVRTIWHAHDHILHDAVVHKRNAGSPTLKQRLIHRLAPDRSLEAYLATPVIAVSRFIADEYRQLGWPGELVSVVPNGIPEYFFGDEPRALAATDRWQILFVGRCVEDKGVHVLLEVLRLLGQRRIVPTLTMVGSFAGDASEREFMAKADRLGLLEQIDYRGVLPRQRLPQAYREAACLVAPSLWEEPFGLMSIEAQAAGTPVIASNVGGLPETLENGKTGFLCEPGDAVAIADRVEQLHGDQQLWRKMSNAARAFASKEFRTEDKRDRIERIIAEPGHKP
jgi:glycosyltransferase involved in cell wall biosynthesis